MTSELPKTSVAETLADKIVVLKPGSLPAATRRKCEDLLIDVVGLCVTARNEDYIKSAIAGWDDDGPCTAIGHKRTLTASGAAFVNGTAAHGEDFDDTFEGGPVHAGAVIVPAVLAACERHNPDGRMALIGIAVGTEVLCRLSLVVPKAVHKAGFHPTAIFGAMGAAAGVGAALGLNARQIVDALGIAGSMAGGTNQSLAERAWTKRVPAGRAAQSGPRPGGLAHKQRRGNGYAAKFATPYLLATGFVHGGVGLGAFTESAIRDTRVLALAAKVKFVIDPDNPYPNNYTGHIRATLGDGSVIEERQPHMRGGAQEPLTRQDVTDKFALNAQYGGPSKGRGDATRELLAGVCQGPIQLLPFPR